MPNESYESAVERLRASLPASEIALIETMERVKGVYCESNFDERLEGQFRQLIRTVASRKPLNLKDRKADRTETRAIVLVGESGAGKTSSLDNLFHRNKSLVGYGQIGSGCPLVTVSVASPCTLKSLGTSVLHVLGYPVVRERDANLIWDRVRRMLVENGVLILHFDEMHNLTDRAHVNDIDQIRKTLKSLMVSPTWPVGLIVSGLPSLVPAMRQIEEVRRRGRFIKVPLLTMPDENHIIGQLLKDFAGVADIEIPDGLEDEIGPRLGHACLNRFGTATEFVHEAIEACLQASQRRLTSDHFAEAYAGRTGCGDRMNVFLAPDWADIDPSEVLLDEMPPEPILPEDPKPRRGRRNRG